MNTNQHFFAQLRSTLQRPPSTTTWLAFVELTALEVEDDFIKDVALPYAQDHFNRWPQAMDVYRQWPERWFERLKQHKSCLWGVLARRAHCTYLPTTQRTLEHLLPFAPFISHLSITNHLDSAQLNFASSLQTFLKINNNALISLRLNNTPLQRTPIADILLPHKLSNLKWLELKKLNIHPEELAHLSTHPQWHNLHTIDLQNNALTDAAITHIVTSKSLNLRTLLLLNNPIHGACLSIIANTQNLSQLQSLSLGRTSETNDGLDLAHHLTQLWHSTNLPQLQSLCFHCHHMSVEACKTLLLPSTLTLTRLDIQTDRRLNENERTELRSLYTQNNDLLHRTMTHLLSEQDPFALLPRTSQNPSLDSLMNSLPFPSSE